MNVGEESSKFKSKDSRIAVNCLTPDDQLAICVKIEVSH